MRKTVEGAGVALSVELEGSGSPLLLVHDLAADARDWAPLVAGLAGAGGGAEAGAGGAGGAGAIGAAGPGARGAEGAGSSAGGAEGSAAGDAEGAGSSGGLRTIAYDRRGYGASGAPEPYEGTTVQEQAQDAAAVLAALGADGGDALAVGSGFGALVVLDLLVRLPRLLRGAVLIRPPLSQFSASATAVLSEQRALLEAALRDGGPASAVEAWRPGADDAVRAAHRAFFADFGGLASWPVTRGELRAVAVPVAVVTDDATPPHLVEASDALAALLPGARRTLDGDALAAVRALL